MTTDIGFQEFVVKVHSRCDLACDHCYMYEHQDQNWRFQPKRMHARTVEQTAIRIGEHAAAHRLGSVEVILHGGEPLLFGVTRMRAAIDAFRRHVRPVSRLSLRIHTNAVNLTREFCDLFAEFDVKVGVSLDGDQASHDRHRTFANGKGSHPLVRRALSLLREPAYRDQYAGLLCTVDVRNDPVDVYRALAVEEPPRLDFLLPHATWDQPPLRPDGEPAPYARWLNRVYDLWTADGRPFDIRIFDSVHRQLRGTAGTSEGLGLEPARVVVIETDGAIEQADSLKTAYDGAPATGLDVFTSSFDDAAGHPGIEARHLGIRALALTCRSCPIVAICGGGLYAHRYRTGSGFANPSVYCEDLKGFIMHVKARSTAAATLSAEHPAHLRLPDDVVMELARGYGSADTIRLLKRSQAFLCRSLLGAVLAEARDHRGSDAAAFLVELDRTAPEALAKIVAHPYTRAWAVRYLAPQRGPVEPDTGHLDALALTAAHHAGIDAAFALTPHAGVVSLPGLGALRAPGEPRVEGRTGPDGIRLLIDGEVLRVGTADPDDHGPWMPTRRLTAESCTAIIEDTDPHRDCHGWPASARLDPDTFSAWQRQFARAMDYLIRVLPEYGHGVASGLAAVMPIQQSAELTVGLASASARHAFGAVGAAFAPTSEALALLLVHEFQHAKLGAVLDLLDLFDLSDNAPRHYAPWRRDPRPLEGLLQGAYAHIGVTDFWRLRRMCTRGDDFARAEVEFARWRIQTLEAMDVLLGSGSLTPVGERFVAEMRATVEPWLKEPVSAGARHDAEKASIRHREEYRARMVQP